MKGPKVLTLGAVTPRFTAVHIRMRKFVRVFVSHLLCFRLVLFLFCFVCAIYYWFHCKKNLLCFFYYLNCEHLFFHHNIRKFYASPYEKKCVYTNRTYTYMRVHKKYACDTDTQLASYQHAG